ncbi:MAG: hypothetical protein SNG38_07850 [Rikenellaceae bacterium]
MKTNNNYEAPAIEVIEVEIEDVVLQSSGTDGVQANSFNSGGSAW